jgi:hypothetical protein
MATISEETRPEETTTGKHRKCYQDLQEDHWTGNREVNCQIYCWATKNQGLDLVEGSTTSETVEEPTHIVGVREAGDVGAPATQDNFATTMGTTKGQRKFMLDT